MLESGTSARLRSIRSFRKRATRWPDWNIDSHRVTVICHGSAAKNPDRQRFCGSLFDLGFDLSRNSFRHSINPAVFDGGRALFFLGLDPVCAPAPSTPAKIP